MIGKIEFERGSLVLEDGDKGFEGGPPRLLKWANAELEAYREDYSPAQGPWGANLLRRMAKILGGELTLEKKKPHPPDTIF
jgi:hypothetical protein